MKQSIVEVPQLRVKPDVGGLYRRLENACSHSKALRIEAEPGDTQGELAMLIVELVEYARGIGEGYQVNYLEDGGNRKIAGREGIRHNCKGVTLWLSVGSVDGQLLPAHAREGRRSEVRR